MAKTTTVTTSYTSGIVVNGTAISADKIYANGTQVRRCIVNGKDAIHKFTRTVVTASSNLTLTFHVGFNVSPGSWYRFYSPIGVAITVTDNGSSGFTSITLVNPILTFYCSEGDQIVDFKNAYQQRLPNQSLPIGQTTYLKFNYFKDKFIYKEGGPANDAHYTLDMGVTDPDGVSTTLSIGADYDLEPYYNWDSTQQRVINKTLSDNTVQEY